MIIIGKIVLLIIASIFIGETAKRIIRHLDSFTRHAGIGHFTVTAVIISFATSFPELVVAVSSSLKGVSGLAYGNALGANMINISLVIGLTAIVGRGLFFNHSTRPDKLLLPLSFSFVPLVFALNGSISRLEGLILILLYGFYVKNLISSANSCQSIPTVTVSPPSNIINPNSVRHFFNMLFWIALLIGTAQIVILTAKSLALEIGLPLTFIGIFIVSLGTTLPELFFNIKAIQHHHGSMATANVIGSCVTNANFILGISALINPITFPDKSELILPIVEYLFIAILFFYFINTKKRLDVWEGFVLLAYFIFYALLELLF